MKLIIRGTLAIGLAMLLSSCSLELDLKASHSDLNSSPDTPATPPSGNVWTLSDVYGAWQTDCFLMAGAYSRVYYNITASDISGLQCSYASLQDCQDRVSPTPNPSGPIALTWYSQELKAESESLNNSISAYEGYFFGADDPGGAFTPFWGSPASKDTMFGLTPDSSTNLWVILDNGVIDYAALKTGYQTALQIDFNQVSSTNPTTHIYLQRHTSFPSDCSQ
ncbi:hypothetical protein [Bdellovibrio bacteriovorus]|uniref:hypothetical protein n=1 Tax=Bdellovibrio bacteriovorus TaxID=959 RepID=UPI0035A580C1